MDIKNGSSDDTSGCNNGDVTLTLVVAKVVFDFEPEKLGKGTEDCVVSECEVDESSRMSKPELSKGVAMGTVSVVFKISNETDDTDDGSIETVEVEGVVMTTAVIGH